MQHIRNLLVRQPQGSHHDTYDATFFRKHIAELDALGVSDAVIEGHRTILLEYIRQAKICSACHGYSSCGKEGDMRGFTQHLERYGAQLTVSVQHCQPFRDEMARRRVERFANLSGGLQQDEAFRFENFPVEQKRKYPRLIRFAEEFANQFNQGTSSEGLYLFGPPGVGKTHLMLAVFNRLQERGIPCLIIRSDSIFDRMRHMIAENEDLEPLIETYATAPVLGIDEFAQERANDFTLEKWFRIINSRFHSKLPTWFTSNYAPPAIYKKSGADLNDSVGPLRSRIMQMVKLAKLEGEDARQRNLESLT